MDNAALSRDFDDAEQSFNYARTAASRGDIRGAIAALERVLQINPTLANVKLELGLLYLRAGEQNLAQYYLEAALVAPDAPETARVRARQGLAQIKQSLQRLRVSGSVLMNASYQSNPNGSPDRVSLVSGGVPVIIDGSQYIVSRGADASGSFAAAIDVSHDLGGQRNSALVLDAVAGHTEYARLTSINTTYVNGRFGPRFALGSALTPSGSVRPFVQATYFDIGGDTLFWSMGGGASFYRQLNLSVGVAMDTSYERRRYKDSPRRAADGQNGDYWSAGATVDWQIGPATRASAGLRGEWVSADSAHWSRQGYGAEAGLARALKVGKGNRYWIARIGTSYRRLTYDQPDRMIDPTRARVEDRFELDGGLAVPITPRLALDLRIRQTWNNASLPNFEFANTAATLGLSFRF